MGAGLGLIAALRRPFTPDSLRDSAPLLLLKTALRPDPRRAAAAAFEPDLLLDPSAAGFKETVAEFCAGSGPAPMADRPGTDGRGCDVVLEAASRWEAIQVLCTTTHPL